MGESLLLRSERLAVEVRPDKGADIASIVDVGSGIDVLFQAPWGRRDLATAPSTGDSQVDWLARYGGGWQQLVPNAGAPRVVDGVERGYHGEAAIIGWHVHDADDEHAVLSTQLITAPLLLTRELHLDGPTLTVTDTIRNTSAVSVPVMWVQHPGFGAPFVDEHCVLRSGARTIISDAEAPGTLLPADRTMPFPRAGADDAWDLSAVPAQGSARAVFGCLTDFEDGWFAIDSPTAGFGVLVEWDSSVLPHAWFWQECHASRGFPWYGRAYVVAVEPANVIPGNPSPGCRGRGEAPLLAGGGVWTSTITFTRRALPETPLS